jgi:hypothetical protein
VRRQRNAGRQGQHSVPLDFDFHGLHEPRVSLDSGLPSRNSLPSAATTRVDPMEALRYE